MAGRERRCRNIDCIFFTIAFDPAESSIDLSLFTQKLGFVRRILAGQSLFPLLAIAMTSCRVSGGSAGVVPPAQFQAIAQVASEGTPAATAETASTPEALSTPAPKPAEPPPYVAVSIGPAVPIYHGRTNTNALALTFDAGADVGYASLILDTLERNGIRASFGMTGQWAVAHPDLVSRMVADGDQLLNHTWDHRSMTGASTSTSPMSRDERVAELSRTDAVLSRIAGQSTQPFFRAPYGDEDGSVDADAGRAGYHYDVLWTVDTGGWAGAPVGRIVAKSAAGAVPGAIIVMHVGVESQDGPALQGVIDAIRARGLQFATVADLVN
jgi:peptidoglycan-N-acetylglucosamine deacetylase